MVPWVYNLKVSAWIDSVISCGNEQFLGRAPETIGRSLAAARRRGSQTHLTRKHMHAGPEPPSH